MHVLPRHAVITFRNGRWAKLRVRGLVRNASLASRLASAGIEASQIRLDTGAVRVSLTPEQDEAYWIDRLSKTVEAHLGESPAPRGLAASRRPPDPAPRTRAPAYSRTPRPSPPVTAAAGPASEATHSAAIDRLLADLGGDRPVDVERGLTAADAQARLARDGPNEIRDITGRSTAKILLGQFTSVPVALLGASGGLALATRAFADAGAIGAVLAANATLGFVTERRAEETVSSLRKLGPR
ncbi:MAG: hypothetical protein EHM83_14680, partial [Burkholderiales bacterium]